MLRERSEGCKVCHPQFSNGILLPVNWRVHVFKLPVMIDLVSDEAHTVAKSLLDNTPNYLSSWVRYPKEVINLKGLFVIDKWIFFWSGSYLFS